MQRCPSTRTIEKRVLIDGNLVQDSARSDQCVITADHGGCHIYEADVRNDEEVVQRWHRAVAG